MLTPTISTPSQSTVTVRLTCLQMTCALTSGIWRSLIAASVSFVFLNPCSQHLLKVFTEFIIVSSTDFTHLLWVFVIWHFSFQVVIVLGILKCFYVVGVQFVQEKYETLAPF